MEVPRHYSLFLKKRQIQDRLGEMNREISENYDPSETIIVGILGGALFFMADLVRNLDPGFPLDFLALSSYLWEEKSSGTVHINKDLSTDCREKTVLILDDILDTGQTLKFARRHVLGRGARAVESAVLLAKEEHRGNRILARHVGFYVPDTFYIGYGLDLKGRYRGLKDIYRKATDHG